MAYIYSAFYQPSQTGLPVQRSLSINYPFNDKIYANNYQYEFLFGDDILIAPSSNEKSKRFICRKAIGINYLPFVKFENTIDTSWV